MSEQNMIYEQIKKDQQIWKFCFYGLLKNLKFFEPYLLIYLMSLGLNLFMIGVLYAIREAIVYIFEVPSGIIADSYGKKKELMVCFTFYIVSFVFFFIGSNFLILLIAMVFFGLGEAFRSGTHKAMMYTYLEQKNWDMHKTFVYGRTRSFSLLGSSISAFVSIIFVLILPELRYLFLLCITPYLLDFSLIASYPDSLDERRDSELSMKGFFGNSYRRLKSISSNKNLEKILLSSSLYDSIFKSIKDYIQPILLSLLLADSALKIAGFSSDEVSKVYLGLIYGIFYIFSSYASRNVYRLNSLASSGQLMSLFFDIMAISSIILCLAIKNSISLLVVVVFFLLYILKDARRPLFVDVCGDNMKKDERATALSVDSMLASLFMVIFAPLFGLIADHISMAALFLIIGVLMLISNRFLHIAEGDNVDYSITQDI